VKYKKASLDIFYTNVKTEN